MRKEDLDFAIVTNWICRKARPRSVFLTKHYYTLSTLFSAFFLSFFTFCQRVLKKFKILKKDCGTDADGVATASFHLFDAIS